jgi:hypothetical protein
LYRGSGSLPVENKKIFSVTNILLRILSLSTYVVIIVTRTTTTRLVPSDFKVQTVEEDFFEAKSVPGMKFVACKFLFEEIKALKRQ